MFKKPRRNFRGRQKDSDDEGDRDETSSASVNSTGIDGASNNQDETSQDSVSFKKKKKKKRDGAERGEGIERSTSALSFQDLEEEETETFQIKKSSLSRRVAKQVKRATLREKEEQEEKKLNNSQVSKPGLYSAENLQKMRADQSQENAVIDEMELSDEEEDEEPEQFSEAQSLSNVFQSGQIPDANLIHLARKRRQLAREKGEDFIPVDDTVRVNKNKSRLVREDDNDVSDEEDAPINFTVNATKDQARRHIETTIRAAAEDSLSEGSDHEETWVQQQIRKGVQAAGQPASGNKTAGWSDMGAGYPQTFYGETYMDQGTPSYPPDKPNETNISLEQIRKRLQNRVDELTSVHRAHINERSDIEARLASCQTSSQTQSAASLEEQYRFFQEMRGYVRDLVECLNEKMSAILYLERTIHQLLKSRADRLLKRRQDDLKDESLLHSAAKASLGVSANGGSSTPQEPLAQRRAAEREGRRSRRRRAREALSISDHYDGLSTDDEESVSESTKFTTEREEAARNAATLFEDIVDDFHELDLIKSRFESWKKTQRDSYENAYISLCLPRLFSPLIRIKLANWNPLEEGCLEFERMRWFETLIFFSSGAEEPEYSDLKLMSSLVEKVIVPKLTYLVENVYDPLSSSQTQRLARTVNKLASDYPSACTASKNTQGLLKAVITRLKRCLDEDVYVPLYTKQVTSNRSTPIASFFHRQHWSAIKLFSNMLAWQGVIGDSFIKELVLDGLLNRYLVLGLFNCPTSQETVAKCQKITDCVPSSWFDNQLEDSTLPQLNNFCRVMVTLAKSPEVSITGTEKKSREIISKQVIQMLINLHALDLATVLTSS